MLLRAFAKVNLDLRILGRRSDGYHELRTVLQTIDWHDDIEIEPSDRFEFRVQGLPADESNLVVRAVREFETIAGQRVNARIELRKNVPVGAGLGGGSADAAVTFLGLERMFGIEIPRERAAQSLRRLGSDVPFFAVGGRAQGVGRGDEITSLEDETGYWLVILSPSFSITTAEAYSWLTVPDKSNSIEGFRVELDSGSTGGDLQNDFEQVVFARHPILAEMKAGLLGFGARQAALSGSGSAIFGIFSDEVVARHAAAALARYGAAKVTKPLPRSEYLRRIFSS